MKNNFFSKNINKKNSLPFKYLVNFTDKSPFRTIHNLPDPERNKHKKQIRIVKTSAIPNLFEYC